MKKILPILAVAFSGFLVYLFDKIWGNSINWEQFKIGKFLSIEFSLGKILIFIGLCILIYLIGKKYLIGNKDYYSKKQKKLRKYNNSNDPDVGILSRWKVYFDSYGTPSIAELNLFCTKHDEAPIRFMHNSCPIKNCENNHSQYNKYELKNIIESKLIDKWEKMK